MHENGTTYSGIRSLRYFFYRILFQQISWIFQEPDFTSIRYQHGVDPKFPDSLDLFVECFDGSMCQREGSLLLGRIGIRKIFLCFVDMKLYNFT